jgi:acetyl-CoA carboxylase carboxyl transferase subunit beta
MSWLTDVVRPKIKAFITRKKETPDNLWTKCTKCEHMLFHRDLAASLFVCHYCQKHMSLSATERLKSLFDNQQYIDVPIPAIIEDPLNFKDSKKYTERLKIYRQKTNRQDSAIVAYGTIGGKNTVIYLLDFSFMGGSMGLFAGKAMVVAANMAVKTKSPLLAITSSGGARMQEGILSLMQMPRTTVAVQMVKEAGLPYITLLTDPTTGGVSASFAMLGDIAIAEPGATIGFAGARVTEKTIRQHLPEGFQTAEYALDHGMIDMVIHRHKLKETLTTLLHHIH